MQVSLDLALANRIYGLLLDVLSTKEEELLFEAATEEAVADTLALGEAIGKAEFPELFG